MKRIASVAATNYSQFLNNGLPMMLRWLVTVKHHQHAVIQATITNVILALCHVELLLAPQVVYE